MRNIVRLLLPLLTLLLSLGSAPAADDAKAKELAKAVVAASGGDKWSQVECIDFTFNVDQGPKTLMSAKHHWNVQANTDDVSWNGKTVTVESHGGEH